MYGLAAPRLDLRSRFRLSLYANLFGVFFGSDGDTWCRPWKLAGIEAPGAVPTLGRLRTRSGAAAGKGVAQGRSSRGQAGRTDWKALVQRL